VARAGESRNSYKKCRSRRSAATAHGRDSRRNSASPATETTNAASNPPKRRDRSARLLRGTARIVLSADSRRPPIRRAVTRRIADDQSADRRPVDREVVGSGGLEGAAERDGRRLVRCECDGLVRDRVTAGGQRDRPFAGRTAPFRRVARTVAVSPGSIASGATVASVTSNRGRALRPRTSRTPWSSRGSERDPRGGP